MLLDLTQSLQSHPTKAHVLWELSNCISSAVGADSFRLYLAENGNADALNLYIGHDLMDNGEPRMQKVKSNSHSVPTYVARTRDPVRLSRGDPDPRFTNVFAEMVSNDEQLIGTQLFWRLIIIFRFDSAIPKGDIAISHIMCQAISQPDGALVAVLEILRREDEEAFHEEDEEIAYSYLVWGGIALHYAHLFLNMNKQRKLNDFLLAVVKWVIYLFISSPISNDFLFRFIYFLIL